MDTFPLKKKSIHFNDPDFEGRNTLSQVVLQLKTRIIFSLMVPLQQNDSSVTRGFVSLLTCWWGTAYRQRGIVESEDGGCEIDSATN